MTEDGYYGLSIPIWRSLLKERPNANLNYKLGSCYLNLGIDRDRGLPYLIEAAKNVEKIYDPFSSSFESSPIEVYYYLGKAYHINSELDSAEKYYTLFLNEASKKKYLRPAAEKGLEMCKVARELMAKPLDVRVVNIGSPINSRFAEYTPIVAYDENTLYFTSRKLRTDSSNKVIDASTGLYYEDMYVSYKSLGGKWMKPELLDINVADDHSSVVSMSPDGRKLYIYKVMNGNGNIYESDFKLGTGWTTPRLVGSNVNSDENEYFATISSDDNTLYFVSDRKGGKGGKDIWYCKRLPTGEWGKAINMGAPVNTEFDEDAPYMHPDGKTMYFSSNGHRSMGGYDIFHTQLLEDNTWSTPRNAGYPINTTDDDHSYIGTPSGKRAYYSSKGANSIGSTDIYVVDYNQEEDEQQPVYDMGGFALIKGWIFPAPGESFPTNLDIVLWDKNTNELAGRAKPVERNGSFVFIVPSGTNYTLEVDVDGTISYTEALSIPKGKKYQELEREIFLLPGSNGKRAIGLAENVLGDAVKWRLLNKDPKKLLPIGTKVYYMDEENTIIDSAYVSKDGFFEYKPLDSDQQLILRPASTTDNSELVIAYVDENGIEKQQEFVLVNGAFYKKGEAPIAIANEDDESIVADATKTQASNSKSKKEKMNPKNETVEKPIEKPMRVNEEDILIYFKPNTVQQLNDAKLNQAVALIKMRIEQKGSTSLNLIGSASKVPTGFEGGNERLAELRLNNGKAALINELKRSGVDMNKISTIDSESRVSGPEYKASDDPKSKLFIDHQYFMIQVN
ncbi:MAG: hypothetical protein Salg2KO_13180 [Salibacteraceae bacterium]